MQIKTLPARDVRPGDVLFNPDAQDIIVMDCGRYRWGNDVWMHFNGGTYTMPGDEPVKVVTYGN